MNINIEHTYTFELDHSEVIILGQIIRSVLYDSRRLGFGKPFTADQIELCTQIETILDGQQRRLDVAVSADRGTVVATE